MPAARFVALVFLTCVAAAAAAEPRHVARKPVTYVRGTARPCTEWDGPRDIVIASADDYEQQLGACTWDETDPRPPVPHDGQVLVLVERPYVGCGPCLRLDRVSEWGDTLQLVVRHSDQVGPCATPGVAAAWMLLETRPLP